MSIEKHLFAIYISSGLVQKSEVQVGDPVLYHRIVRVLRLQEGDNVILFNQQINMNAQVKTIGKKIVTFSTKSSLQNKELQPQIIVGLGILKPDAFAEALYSCTELGANKVVPLITDKSSAKKLTGNWQDRANKIIHGAAEQSKNFAFPDIVEPQKLLEFTSSCDDELKIYLDPNGELLFDAIAKMRLQKLQKITLLIGPEGDLTVQEKALLQEQGFIFCRLTPTVLRSVQAVAVGLGVIRSSIF